MLMDAPYNLYESVFRTGSSVICNPPVTDTDEDYMFYTPNRGEFQFHLLNSGWELCGEEEYGGEDSNWVALRKGKLNYLLTDDEEHFEKFKTATFLATKLNLKEKQQRIDLFQYIVDGTI